MPMSAFPASLPYLTMMRRLCRALWLCMALLMAQAAHAKCDPTSFLEPKNLDFAIKLRFGHINLTAEALQPYDAPLGSLAVPATDYPYPGANPDTVLWRCDATDKIRFLVATNAGWKFGGMHDLGKLGDPDDTYLTAFRNIGLRLRMDGVTLTDHWQAVPVKSFRRYKAGNRDMIAIRLRDIPVMEAELLKVNWRVPKEDDIVGCHYGNPGPRITYQCPGYNGYLQLDGPGLHHDEAGTLASNSHAYTFNNGLAWGMYQAMSLSRVKSCVFKSATPHVRFAPVSAQQLMEAGAAGAASASFSVEVDCNGSLDKVSGVGENKTAIGLQVSPGAFAAAKARGLVDMQSHGVGYLLSDQYGTPGMAEGVGITLHDKSGEWRWFVGQPGTVGTGHPGGANAGWYPVLHSAEQIGNSSPDIRHHRLDFTAKLVKLPNAQEVTPGKVRATAHVLVKVQ